MRSRAMSSQRAGAVVGEQLLHLRVGAVDVLRVARQRAPAERPDAAAEQRADIGRHEAREGEGVFQPLLQRHLADVVAVVERRHTGVPEIDHGATWSPSRRAAASTAFGSLSRRARHSAMVQPFGR
jgi:hypothetical protein